VSPPPVYPNGTLLAGRFEIVRRIGEGGMGIVYDAVDRERGTTVALKSITQPDPTAIFRFKREFRSLADIGHPNPVPLYELVSTDDWWFFTMQLVEGTDLACYLRPPPRVVSGVALNAAIDDPVGSVQGAHGPRRRQPGARRVRSAARVASVVAAVDDRPAADEPQRRALARQGAGGAHGRDDERRALDRAHRRLEHGQPVVA
jgi:hypothetical protein